MSQVHGDDFFNLYLQLPTEELSWEFGRLDRFSPDELAFLINPRRLRGSDFLMRWTQGRWSEEIVVHALDETDQFGVIRYGPSTVAPEDPSELEFFFEKMDVIAKEGKRPDLLLYDKVTVDWARRELEHRLGSVEKMAETSSEQVRDVITKARAAFEVENSLFVKVPYVLCKEFGMVSGPTLVPKTVVDRNGKVMTYVTFSGGEIHLSPAVFEEWGR
jgi:hypothetical protein